MHKAIIEQIIDRNHARVRVPFYNRSADSPLATPTEDLGIATICAIPNSSMNYAIGDIVFIDFEDNNTDKPIILGQLQRNSTSAQNSELNLFGLHVDTFAELPYNTYIGDIKPEEINRLSGIKDNIQKQIDLIKPSGGPEHYLKDATVANQILTITKQDDTTVTYSSGLVTNTASATLVGDGVNDSYFVTHGLNTRDVIVQIYDLDTYETIVADVVRTTLNAATITFITAPAIGKSYKILFTAMSATPIVSGEEVDY